MRALRALARLQQHVITASGPAALLVFASGVYMTPTGWSFTHSWLAVALVLFVANGTLAMSVVGPHVRKVLAAADEASDGPLDRDLTDLVHSARVIGSLRIVIGIDLAIIFLMVNKPGWAGSVAVAGTGLALGRPWPPWRRGGYPTRCDHMRRPSSRISHIGISHVSGW